jgi:hypothetical protein
VNVRQQPLPPHERCTARGRRASFTRVEPNMLLRSAVPFTVCRGTKSAVGQAARSRVIAACAGPGSGVSSLFPGKEGRHGSRRHTRRATRRARGRSRRQRRTPRRISDIRDQHADQRDAWADAPIARVLAPIALLTRSASPMHTGLRLGVRPSVPALGPTTDVPRSPRDRIRRPAHPRGRSVG